MKFGDKNRNFRRNNEHAVKKQKTGKKTHTKSKLFGKMKYITNLPSKCRRLFVFSVVAVGHKDTQCYRSEPKMRENQEKTTLEKAQEHKKI